jgi:hypothetical protein
MLRRVRDTLSFFVLEFHSGPEEAIMQINTEFIMCSFFGQFAHERRTARLSNFWVRYVVKYLTELDTLVCNAQPSSRRMFPENKILIRAQ